MKSNVELREHDNSSVFQDTNSGYKERKSRIMSNIIETGYQVYFETVDQDSGIQG